MHKKFVITLFLLFSTITPAIVSDTMLLAQLASTTASQLRELTGLLKQTKELSDKFNTIETAIDEKVDFAERIQLQAEEIKDLEELSRSEDMDDLISNLKELKSTVADTKEFVREVKVKQAEAKKREKRIKTEKRHVNKRKNLSNGRFKICAKGQNPGSSSKCTSMNTALILKESQESNKHLIEQKEMINDLHSLELARAVRDRKEKEEAKKLVKDFQIEGVSNE